MKILSTVLVVLYALLNLFLAVVGTVRAGEVGLTAKLLPAAVFVMAAAGLGWGAVRHSTVWVIVGLVLASVAPVLYGALVEHSNVLLHHLVRAGFEIIVGVLWVLAWRSRS